MAYQPKSYRKFVATAATATLVAGAVAPFASAADASKFTDVSKSYQDAVNFVVSKGANGKTETTFGTSENITRVDAAVLLVKVLGLDTEGAPASGFKDVPARAVKEVNALKAAGITSGKSETTFNSNAKITRGELAVWIQRGFALEGSAAVNFKDVNSNYYQAVSALVANKVTSGKTPTTFGTSHNATRGEYAIFLYKAFQASDAIAVSSVKAINATTVEVTYKEKVTVEDIAASKYTIDGLEVKNAAIKQTDSKTVVLTTAAQEAGKSYTVKNNGTTVGSFTGVSAVIPTAVDVTTSSLQGIIGQEVTLKAQVTVKEGDSKAGIPVTFNIVNGNKDNKTIEVEATTNADGVATYSYTRYYSSEDNVAAYATSKSSVISHGKVYWANKIQLAVSEITVGNELANETKKSYKVTGSANTTYYIAIKENLNVAPDNIKDVKVQNHGTQNFVTPYELTTGATNYATVTTNASGEGSFTIYGTNLSATPIVYAPQSTPTTPASFNYNKLDLQAVAPTVKFSQVDRLAIAVVSEGTADSAEYFGSAPVAYDANSAGGRTYTVTVTDKEGKVAPAGTVAYVAFNDFKGDVYFSTGTENFVKVAEDDIKKVIVGKEGKAQFRVAGKGATTYVKPTVFLNTAGKTSPVELDKTDVQAVSEVTYFKTPVVTNAVLKVTDELGRAITSTNAGQDAYFTYQSVDQNGFAYRPGNYTVTPGTTQTIYEQKTDPLTGAITWVPKTVVVDPITSNNYVLAFDVTSTFGDATVKNAAGQVLTPLNQNLGSTKTYNVNSNANGTTVVRVTSLSADKVSVNVTGSGNILPTQTASVSFVNSSLVPALYTGVVESIDTTNQTLKFAGKQAIRYVGDNVSYKGLGGITPIGSATNFEDFLLTAGGSVQVTYEVKDGATTFYIYSVTSGGTRPVDTVGTATAKQALQSLVTTVDALALDDTKYTSTTFGTLATALASAKAKLADATATQVDYTTAKTALQTAYDGLKSAVTASANNLVITFTPAVANTALSLAGVPATAASSELIVIDTVAVTKVDGTASANGTATLDITYKVGKSATDLVDNTTLTLSSAVVNGVTKDIVLTFNKSESKWKLATPVEFK